MNICGEKFLKEKGIILIGEDAIVELSKYRLIKLLHEFNALNTKT